MPNLFARTLLAGVNENSRALRNLGTAPLIDLNIYTDMVGDIHDRFRAFSLRDRLPEGSSQQIWTRGDTTGTLSGALGNLVTRGGT